MSDLLSQVSEYRIELDYEVDGEYIFSVWDSAGKLLAASCGRLFSDTQSRFEWMLLELGIII